MIADIFSAKQYANASPRLGLTNVTLRGLGWRMWWGGWMPTRLVTAVRSPDCLVIVKVSPLKPEP